MDRTVLRYLTETAAVHGERQACADVKSSYSYSQMLDISRTIGARLSQKIGLGAPVPFYMEKSCEALLTIWGILFAGGFYAALDCADPAERTRRKLDLLGAEILIADRASQREAKNLNFSGEILLIEDLMEGKRTAEDERRLQEVRSGLCDIDPLYMMFTSGSTGTPKGVLVSHRSVVDFIDCFAGLFHITCEDIMGNQAPLHFDVSVKDIFTAAKVGAAVQIIPRSYFVFPIKLAGYLEERGVTTLIWAVSALCILTSQNVLEKLAPSRINKIIFSGEVMPLRHLRLWRSYYPEALFVNVYGPTEITCNCCYYVTGGGVFKEDYPEAQGLPIGKPFPNERVFLLDGQGKLIEPRAHSGKGEICVSGTAVALGYYNDDARTDSAFVQNPLNHSYREIIYRTGDLGYYNGRKELCFAGRKDSQIKYMGHRIELTEIELRIGMTEGVMQACCMFDEENNRIVCAYSGTAERKQIVRRLLRELPRYMVPSAYLRVADFPLTPNGKVDRQRLLEDIRGKHAC